MCYHLCKNKQTDRSGKKVRCMFLTSVAIGRAFTTMQGKLKPEDNLCPPPGFDSVIGEVREEVPPLMVRV